MKRNIKAFVVLIITFISIYITPAIIASMITLDPTIYLDWVVAPAYCAIMFFLSTIVAVMAVDGCMVD